MKISETSSSAVTMFSGASRGGERDVQVGKNKAVSPISGTPCTSACHAIDTTTISVNAVHSVLTFSWNSYSFLDHGVGSLSALWREWLPSVGAKRGIVEFVSAREFGQEVRAVRVGKREGRKRRIFANTGRVTLVSNFD